MKTNASSPATLEERAPGKRGDPPVQTGALSGGQPGQGVNKSSSAPGQSNTDATAGQGTEYGTHEAQTPSSGSTVDDDDRRVREAAYRRFEARGSVHGHAEEDWLAAEREVRPPAGN